MGAQRRLVLCLSLWACVGASSARAQSALQRVEGLGPDAQLVGGVGLGLREALDNPFVARARLGLLYAYEPWVFAAGPCLQAGALATPGFGAELELSHFDGWYADVGVIRAHEDGWVTHAAFGFMVLGLEWQHRFDIRDEDALLLQVRVPLGTWWFVDRKREEQAKRRAAAAGSSRRTPVWQVAPSPDPMPQVEKPEPTPGSASEPATVGHVRVLVTGEVEMLTAEIDGQPAPTALRGYDVPLPPGEHELVLRRGELEIGREKFTVEAGQLVRVSPVLRSEPTHQ